LPLSLLGRTTTPTYKLKMFFASRTKNPPFLFEVCEITPTFAAFSCQSPLRVRLREGNVYIKRRTLRFVFDVQESGSSKNEKRLSKTRQQRRPVGMYSPAPEAAACISAWASALLVSTNKRCQSFCTWDEQ
jgi:hypothetical protein